MPKPQATQAPSTRELVSRLPVWNIHPEINVSDTFPIAEAHAAYQLADTGQSGKVALVP